MFEPAPISASPTYVRCGTFDPGPMTAALVSTYAPILPASPRTVPGRRNEYGPTDAPAPISAPVAWLRTTLACGPTTQSRKVVSGPMVAPDATRVAPSSWVPGSSVTSAASSTLASSQV